MVALLTKLYFVTSMGLQLLILYLLIRARLQRRFFWFLGYILYELCEAALRLAVAGEPLYKRVYWVTAIGGAIFSVLAVSESFLNVFREYARLRWFAWTVWSCVGLALLYSLLKTWILPPVGATRIGVVAYALEATVDYSLTAVGLLYLALVLFFGIKEHQWETGIISGFTIVTGVAVFGVLIRSAFGPNLSLFQWIPAVAYILGEIEWAMVLNRPERPVRVPAHNLIIDDLTNLNQYSRVLRRLFGRKP